jgi:hypothetical protein
MSDDVLYVDVNGKYIICAFLFFYFCARNKKRNRMDAKGYGRKLQPSFQKFQPIFGKSVPYT